MKRRSFWFLILVALSAEPGRPDLASCFAGWIPAGKGTDFVWQGWNLFHVMTSSGQPRRILKLPQLRVRETGVTDATYDGRFVWVTSYQRDGDPRLWVIHLPEEKIWEIGPKDGLPIVPADSIPDPTVDSRLWVESLAPGKILLVSGLAMGLGPRHPGERT